ncbi:MAG: hypothetical protein ACM3Q2_00250, partial [Syntrophothermus sp.]
MQLADKLVPKYFTFYQLPSGARFFIPTADFERLLVPKVIESIYQNKNDQKDALHKFQVYIFMTRTPKTARLDNLLNKRKRKFFIRSLHSRFYPSFSENREIKDLRSDIDRLLKLAHVEAAHKKSSFKELLEEAVYYGPVGENSLGPLGYSVFKSFFFQVILEENDHYYRKDEELIKKMRDLQSNKSLNEEKKKERFKALEAELKDSHTKHYEILHEKFQKFLHYRKKLAEGFSYIFKKVDQIIDKTFCKEIDLCKKKAYLVDESTISLEELDGFYKLLLEHLQDKNVQKLLGKNNLSTLTASIEKFRNGDHRTKLKGVYRVRYSLSDPELPFDSLFKEIETTALEIYDQTFRKVLPLLIQEEKLSNFEADLFRLLHFGHPLFNGRIVMYERLLQDYTFIDEILSELVPEFISQGGLSILEKTELTDEDYDRHGYLKILMAYLVLYPSWELLVSEQDKVRAKQKKNQEHLTHPDRLENYGAAEGEESPDEPEPMPDTDSEPDEQSSDAFGDEAAGPLGEDLDGLDLASTDDPFEIIFDG